MDTYNFFLFSKLFDIHIRTNMTYDDLYHVTCNHYEAFESQDHNFDIDLYEAIDKYLKENAENIIKTI